MPNQEHNQREKYEAGKIVAIELRDNVKQFLDHGFQHENHYQIANVSF